MKKDIVDSINELAENRRIFSREAQFQFELAWVLKEKLGSSYEIILEYLIENTDNAKMYIDIIVFNKEERMYYPIELKCKTSNKEITYTLGNPPYHIKTYNQGAFNLGSYDFINDIKRIESLNNIMYKGIDYSIGQGFAIILCNDKRYYEPFENWAEAADENGLFYHSRSNGPDEYYYWQEFSLASVNNKRNFYWRNPEGDELIQEIWEDGKNMCGNNRTAPIILNNEYSFEWTEYNLELQEDTDNQFKYLVVTIPPEP